MALCICAGTSGAQKNTSKVRGSENELQWRAGRESDSAFRRGKEAARGHAYARQLDESGSRSGRRVACVAARRPGGDCVRAACCVPCLREMSRQRARARHACGCMWPRVRRTCGICPDLASWALKQNTSRALEISQDATQRDLDLSLRTHISVLLLPCFPPVLLAVHHIHST